MSIEFLLSLTPAQFKRVRADYRLLTLHFRMSSDVAVSIIEGCTNERRALRQQMADERRQQQRDSWQVDNRGVMTPTR